MFRVAVVEDNDMHADTVMQYVERYAADNGFRTETKRYFNGYEFIADKNFSADIILMDIEMPVMDGMDASKKLRERCEKSPIIFITCMDQYAVKGYEVDAIGFMVKPVTYFDFQTNFGKAVRAVESARDSNVSFTMKDGVVKFSTDDIKYVEVSGHMITFHTFDRDLETRGSMKEIEKAFDGKNFARCNSCYLVNLKYVSQIEKNIVSIAGGGELVISKNKRKEFITAVCRADILRFWWRAKIDT